MSTTTQAKKRKVPTDLKTALEERAHFRELGRTWRERALTAEGTLEQVNGTLLATQLLVSSRDDTISALRAELESAVNANTAMATELQSLQDELAALTQSTVSSRATTIIVSKDGGEVLEAIALAQDAAIQAIERAAHDLMRGFAAPDSQALTGATASPVFADGPPTFGDDDDTVSEDDLSDDDDVATNEDSEAFDFDFGDDDDDDVEVATDEDEPVMTADDDDDAVAEDVTVSQEENAGDDGDDGDDDDFAVDPSADIDASLTTANLINMIVATAEGLGDTWRDTMQPFVTQALNNGNKRLIVREAINAVGVAEAFSDHDIAHTQAFANELEEAEFDQVLTAILQANDGALNEVAAPDQAA